MRTLAKCTRGVPPSLRSAGPLISPHPGGSCLVGKVKITASVRFVQTQKCKSGCWDPPIDPTRLVSIHESHSLWRCGPETQFAPLTFRHFSQCSQVYGHAPGGQLGRALSGTRSRITRMSGFSRLHSLGKSKAELCDKYQYAN